MKHAIPDVATARRCLNAIAEYLATKDDSPRAAADLRESVRLLAAQPVSGATCQTCQHLRESLAAARDAMAAFGTQASVVQGGYSATMTRAEKQLADAVASIDDILALPPVPAPSGEESK